MGTMMTFDDYTVGQKISSSSRTITETHLVNYLGVSGIAHPIFVDVEFAKRSSLGARIVPAFLTLSVATGLLEESMDLTSLVAVLGFDEMRLITPVCVNDTLHIDIDILDKRASRTPGRGIMTGLVTVLDHHDSTMATYKIAWLLNGCTEVSK